MLSTYFQNPNLLKLRKPESTFIRSYRLAGRRIANRDYLLKPHYSLLKMLLTYPTTYSSQVHTRIFFKELLIGRFHKIAKSDYWLRHVCSSVYPPAWKSRLPLGGFHKI
jgi:hypothetical protein